MQEPLPEFSLSLHPEKTRLIAFGRLSAKLGLRVFHHEYSSVFVATPTPFSFGHSVPFGSDFILVRLLKPITMRHLQA
jgi:hypothetical protein